MQLILCAITRNIIIRIARACNILTSHEYTRIEPFLVKPVTADNKLVIKTQ